MKRITALLILLFPAGMLLAQSKLLSMEDAMLNARTTLAPENLRQLQFIKGTNDYVYLKKIDGTDVWMKGSFAGREESVFLTLQQFNEKLRAGGLDTVKALIPVQFGADNWVISLKGQRISLDTKDNRYTILIDKNTSSKENVERSEDGYVAYVDKFNLFVAKGTDVKQVTSDGSKDIVYASSVHRDEFGIHKGTFWSNNGKMLAFYRMDQSMVTDYPIIDWTQYPAVNENIKYPMAGGKSHHVTVAVYNAVTNNTVWLKTGEPAEQYLTNISWSPDDKSVYIAVVNREQNHMWLNQYDAATGAFIKTLFEETDSKYVEPLDPMLFVKGNPGQFIWQSRRMAGTICTCIMLTVPW